MNSLLNLWQLLGWTMILFLAAGTVVLLIGGALRVILKRANPSVRYSTSLAVFAVLALMPLAIAGWLTFDSFSIAPPSGRGVASIAKNPDPSRGVLATDLHARYGEPSGTGAAQPRHAALRSVPDVPAIPDRDGRAMLDVAATYLPWLWIVGTPLTFLLLATGLIGAERLRSSCQLVSAGPIRTACDELRAALGVGRQVGVAVCERIATPLLVGIVKPLILLPPAALNGWTTAELEMVLLHELAHVRRWDNAVNLAQRIVESLLFFHPAVWIVSNWVRRDREDCCDAVVIRHTARPQAYAELLLALVSHVPGLATSVAMAQHPVASRIRRILKLEDEPMLVTRKGLLFGVSAVLVAALLAFALPTSDAEESVSREAKRVEDERATVERTETTNPARQRGEEQTTKDTNQASRQRQRPENTALATGQRPEVNAKEKLAIVDDTVQYSVVYPLEENEADIKSWLKAIDLANEIHLMNKDGIDMAVVIGTRKEHEKVSALLQSKRGEEQTTKEEASRQRQRPEELATEDTESTEKSSLFPTLEEQRAADLAYKLLGVELEKLTPEDLERVKAKRYEGGLKVTGPIAIEAGQRVPPLMNGDLLVGLHVWPTESLNQVNEILTRNDLHELSPLKFYVIRQRMDGGYGEMGAMGDPAAVDPQNDHIATGRISVDLQAWAEREGFKQERLKQSQPPVSSTSSTPQLDPNPFSDNQNELLYDGKTFDEWRSLWKTELKTEKRVEYIKALAAFGRAGKGKEAAEAILDVAGEYDFSISSRTEGPAEQLTDAISGAFRGGEGLPADQWLPLLIERLESDPKKWAPLTTRVLGYVQGDSVDITFLLKGVAESTRSPRGVRAAALATLATRPDIAEDDEVLAMIRHALAGEDIETALRIFGQLGFSRLDLFPQQIDLLFHEDERLRRYALLRLPLSFTQTFGPIQDASQFLDAIMHVVDDPAQKAKRPFAIEALSALGSHFHKNDEMKKRKRDVDAKLEDILINGDVDLLPATLATTSDLSASDESLVIKALGDKITDERRKELEAAIEKAEDLKKQRAFGGGGGGMGGGGMGGGGMF